LDEKERVRFILEHIMGYFVLKETATGWRTPEYPMGRDAVAIGFHWPIAFWNTDGECWMTRDIATDVTIFSPLQDMNDAWAVLQRIVSLPQHPSDLEIARRNQFVAALGGTRFSHTVILEDVAFWTPEKICIAALKAVEKQ
jgi:hypothetical protein